MQNEGITKSAPQWGEIIKQKRRELRESQMVFGHRWSVSQATVSDWERGVIDPPGELTWWLTHEGKPHGR